MSYIRLSGTVIDTPVLSHKTQGGDIYIAHVECIRLSGTPDILPCMLPKTLIDRMSKGTKVCIDGEVRSRNIENKLLLYVFVKGIFEYTEEENVVYFENAHICNKPTYRDTLTGKHISGVVLAVNRPNGKSDYIPTIVWGNDAKYIAGLNVGDKVTVYGRFQSREYVKRYEDGTEETKVAYEMSVSSLGREVNDGK